MDSKEKMRLGSMIFGILSVIMIFFGLSIPFAALGIILAILSRDSERISGRAVAGLIASLAGLAIGLASTIFSFYIIYSHGSLEQYLQDIYSEYRNTEGSDELQELFGSLGIQTEDPEVSETR